MLNFLKFLTNYYWIFLVLAIFFGISLVGFTKKEKKSEDTDASDKSFFNNKTSQSEEMVISTTNEQK